MKKNKILFASAFLLSIMVLNLVTGAGVVSEYWAGSDAKPLYLLPGESKDIVFTLQNMVGSEDILFKAEIIKGSEYASITDSQTVYSVPAGIDNVEVNVKVAVPSSATIDETHRITLSFSQTQNSNSEQLNFGSAFEKSFDLITSKEPVPVAPTESEQPAAEEKEFSIIYIIVAILIILSIIIYLKRRKG